MLKVRCLSYTGSGSYSFKLVSSRLNCYAEVSLKRNTRMRNITLKCFRRNRSSQAPAFSGISLRYISFSHLKGGTNAILLASMQGLEVKRGFDFKTFMTIEQQMLETKYDAERCNLTPKSHCSGKQFRRTSNSTLPIKISNMLAGVRLEAVKRLGLGASR